MKEEGDIQEFTILGGFLFRFGCRLGLVRDGTNTTRLGIVLGFLAGSVMFMLVILFGSVEKAFSLLVIGIYVRLLIAIPLFFVCETWVAPRMAEFVRNSVNSGLVPQSDLPKLKSDIRIIARLKDSWLVDVIILVAVIVVPVFVNMPGKTGSLESIIKAKGSSSVLVIYWYLFFCLPLFRYLVLRWMWNIGLWCYFLLRMEKLKLHLVPIHPDRTAGLGYLVVTQEHFAPLAVAGSAVLSASFAEEIYSGSMTFTTLYTMIPLVLLLNAVLFICPLFIFSHKLWVTRTKGLDEYMAMAHNYVSAFDHRWIRDEKVTGEDQLGTPDLQSLADLANSMNIVESMKIIPISSRLVFLLTASTVIPFLPLLLFKYPLTELLGKLFGMLSGL